MSLFSDNHLKLLRNLNTGYEGFHDGTSPFAASGITGNAGIEMSTGIRQQKYPNGVKTYAKSHQGIFAGSILFNALYAGEGSGAYTEFGWRTGWSDYDKLSAGKCTLMFGLIPITWSDGIIGSTRYVPTSVRWRNGFVNNIDPAPYFASLGIIQGTNYDVKETTRQYDQFKSLSDSSKMIYTWDNNPEAIYLKNITIRPMTANWYMLGDIYGLPNNYTSIKKITDYSVVGGSSADKTNTVENYIKDIYMPNESSMCLRFGNILCKSDPSHIGAEHVVGFIKHSMLSGAADGTLITMYKRNGNGTVGAATDSYSNICNARGGEYLNEYYFGSMQPDPQTYGTSSGIDFAEILDYLISNLISPSNIGNIGLNNNLPMVCDPTYLNVPCYNMYNVSTIKYTTPYQTESDSSVYKVIDFIPVFAKRVANNDFCCAIHTFQSIIYNTYFHKPFINSLSDTDYNPYSAEEGELTGQAKNVNVLRNYNQCKNTYNQYENFVMKFDDSSKRLYISFALKVIDTNGDFQSISAGPANVEIGDWVAWINGNIYVIPNTLFSKYVFYTQADFSLLNSVTTQMLGVLSGH